MRGIRWRPTRASLSIATSICALAVMLLTANASATHWRPSGGTPYRIPLVPAYNPCGTATEPINGTHAPPLSFDSCSPPQEESSSLTGSPSGVGSGFALIKVMCNDGQALPCSTNPGDQEDVSITISQSDVRCRVDNVNGCSEIGGDYTSSLALSLGLRLTDHSNPSLCTNGRGDPPCTTATVHDFSFVSGIGCAATASTTRGSDCSGAFTLDAVCSNCVQELQRTVWDVQHLILRDEQFNTLVRGGFFTP